jgi:hypothetical protein
MNADLLPIGRSSMGRAMRRRDRMDRAALDPGAAAEVSACVAAYRRAGDGDRRSPSPVATYLRGGAIVVCVAVLLYAAAKPFRRFLLTA